MHPSLFLNFNKLLWFQSFSELRSQPLEIAPSNAPDSQSAIDVRYQFENPPYELVNASLDHQWHDKILNMSDRPIFRTLERAILVPHYRENEMYIDRI